VDVDGLRGLVVCALALGACGPADEVVSEVAGGGSCAADSDCADRQACRSGVCVFSGECDEPLWGCPQDQVCIARQCVARGPCDDAFDCESGEACDGSSCSAVPDVPSCAASPSLFVLAELQQGAANLAFRDADGDGARELVMVGEAGVSQLSAGQPTAEVLLPGASFARDLAVADLDGDGLEDVVLAGSGLRTITAEGATVQIDDKSYRDVELCDMPPHDGVVEGIGLSPCRAPEGCSSGEYPLSLWNDGTGSLHGGGHFDVAYPEHSLAGASLGGIRGVVIAQAEGVTTLGFPEGFWHPDNGVFGAALAGGDLVAGGSDELLRLSPGKPWTVATLWSLTGSTLVPGPRGRIAGELDRVLLGDLDGDGSVDAVLAGAGVVVLWLAPGLLASPTSGCISTLPLDGHGAIAVGDHDGDGRADIAVATTASVTIWAMTP
jgi:hypothetical protein